MCLPCSVAEADQLLGDVDYFLFAQGRAAEAKTNKERVYHFVEVSLLLPL